MSEPPINARVVIGRNWHNPEIYAMVSLEKIEMTMKLEDLVKIISSEVESAMEKHLQETRWFALMTRWGLRKRFQQLDLKGLVSRVTGEAVEEIKKASAHVV